MSTAGSVDLRGFRYALQPVLSRQQWRLQALQARLGAAQRAVAQAQGALALRERELAERAEDVRRAAGARLEPTQLRRGLQWLATERERIARQRRELERLLAHRDGVLAACQAQEAKLESLRQHRTDSEADYVQVEQRRLAAMADRDWLARGAPGRQAP